MASTKTKDLLGLRIKQARREARLSQKDLASKLAVSDKAVSSYEVGRTSPNFRMLQKISRAVDKPITYFDMENDDDESMLVSRFHRMERAHEVIQEELGEIRKLLKRKKLL